jgi:site-specific recombinase XerD
MPVPKGTEPQNKGIKLPGQVLTGEEMHALLAQCSLRAPTGIRDRALLTVIYRAGLRVSEALDLKPSDIDTKRGTVRVNHGKGDKARIVGIGDGALVVLQRWLDVRKELGTAKKGAPLFCTLAGGPMSYSATQAMLKRRAAKAGIESRVHLHGLRHTRAAEMRESGQDVVTIQKQLGHAHLSTTYTYLNHISPADVIAAGRADTWTEED